LPDKEISKKFPFSVAAVIQIMLKIENYIAKRRLSDFCKAMCKFIFQITTVFFLISALIVQTHSQTIACRQSAFTALRPIPKLKYKCRKGIDDYEQKILKYPERIRAVNGFVKALEKFTNKDWWSTDVEDLNICDFSKKAGVFSIEEKERYEQSYFQKMLGNSQFRMISATDPCYQTGYNGANVFLLYRKNGRVFVSEAIDGYFSRSDYGPEINFAANGSEEIVEVSTTSGGLHPTITNYYFTFDKKRNKIVPKKLFRDDGNKLSNKITSQMPLGDSEEYGLPPNLEPLEIFKNKRLAKSFDVFIYTGETFGEDNQDKFKRLTLRWNGKFYK
jgi:hypothetical protein